MFGGSSQNRIKNICIIMTNNKQNFLLLARIFIELVELQSTGRVQDFW